MEKIQAIIISDKVSSNSKQAFDLNSTSRIGEKKDEKIIYSLVETYYLFKSKKLELLDFRDKKLSEKEILKRFEKTDKRFMIKYLVFKDLRDKGYIVKTALKFGAEFRIYEPGKKVGKDHAKWILFPVSENEKLTWHDFSAKNRVAHSAKKSILIAIVDEENDVSYYDVNWLKP